jgi:hypothetical protein
VSIKGPEVLGKKTATRRSSLLILVNTTNALFRLMTNPEPQDYPYMVFSVTQTKERPDWFKLPDLTRPYQELQAAVRRGDYTSAKDLIVTFRRTALTSDDLLLKDAERIGQLVKDKAEAVMTATKVSRPGDLSQRELPALESFPLYRSGAPVPP